MKFEEMDWLEKLCISRLFYLESEPMSVQEWNQLKSDQRLTNPKGVRFAKIKGEWKKITIIQVG